MNRHLRVWRVALLAAFVPASIGWGGAAQPEPAPGQRVGSVLETGDAPSADAAAVLREDGSLRVRVVLGLPDGYPGAFAVDVAGYDFLREVRVRTSGADGKDLPFAIRRDRGVAVIGWPREPGDAASSVEVSYLIGGSVTAGRPGDRLTWSVISSAQEWGFERVSGVLSCPKGQATVLGGAEATTLTRVESGIAVAAERLPAGAPLRLSVALPRGAVRPTFGWVRFMKRTGGAILMFLLPLISFLGLLAAFWLRGRDPATLESTEWPTSGRASLPEVTGTVADEYVDSRDLAAAALDMAREGYLALEYAPDAQGNAGSLAIVAAKSFDPLAPHRRSLAELLTAPEGRARPGEGARVLDAVYAETARQGFFREDPSVERRGYSACGAVMLCLGFVALVAGAAPPRFFGATMVGFAIPLFLARRALSCARLSLRLGLGAAAAAILALGLVLLQPFIGAGGASWIAKLGVGLMLSSCFFLAFAPAMPQRTVKGTAEKAAVMGRRLMLEMLVPPAESEQRDAEFQDGLPYAAVFQMRADWVRRFAAAGASAPPWWRRRAADGSLEGPRSLAEVRSDFLASLDLLTARIEDLMPAGSGG